MDFVEEKFLKKAIIRGGIHMYNASDAIEVISMCEQHGWPIFGVDSFSVTEQQTRPMTEHTLHCSIISSANGFWYEAKAFVNERASLGYYFEIVYTCNSALY